MILMGDRGAEQGHNAVAHDLIDRPLVPVDRLHHALEHRVEDLAGLLRVTVSEQLHRALQIRKEDRDLLALAFQGALRVEDLLGQMDRDVAQGWLGRHGGRCWWRPGERRTTFATELGP
jgi:hypothetical protein